jgi:hypothetical protein
MCHEDDQTATVAYRENRHTTNNITDRKPKRIPMRWLEYGTLFCISSSKTSSFFYPLDIDNKQQGGSKKDTCKNIMNRHES